MNRKMLYAGLVLVILTPFIYGFTKGYSFQASLVNMIAFVMGQEYNEELLLLVVLALLLSVLLVITLTSSATSSNVKRHVILHLSDGRRIAEENQQEVLKLQRLLQETEQEHPNAKRLLSDSSLDMNIF